MRSDSVSGNCPAERWRTRQISWFLSMARNTVVNCVTLILTWLRQLSNWCRPILTCQLIPSETVTECLWCAKGFAVKPFFLVAAAVYTVQSVILWLLCRYLLVSELNVHLYSSLNNTHIIRRVFFSTTIASLWILHGSLFTQILRMAITWTHISQRRVATRLRCGGIFSNYFTANLLLNQPVKEFWKSVKIWWRYCHEFCGLFFFWNTV